MFATASTSLFVSTETVEVLNERNIGPLKHLLGGTGAENLATY